MTLRIIYDDTRVVPDEVVALAGVQQFSSIIFRRKSLLRYMTELAAEAGFQDLEVISRETTDAQLAATSSELRNSEKFLVFPSNVVAMAPRDEVITLLRKLRYAQNNLVLTVTPGVDWTGLVLLDGRMLRRLLAGPGLSSIKSFVDENEDDFFEMQDQVKLIDLRDMGQFLSFLTSNFDVRHFNSISNETYTITKRSTDGEKLQREFTYFSLLPPQMQMYFVQPFDFTQDGQSASYTMERLLIPDMAIQWVHGALSPRDLSKFMERIFHFINLRPKITTQKAPDLHYTNVHRFNTSPVCQRTVRGMPQFGALEQLTAQSVGGLDQVLNRYLSLYDRRRDQIDGRHLSIGHGDLCFSNILYSKSTQLMRFIDPRGAMTRDQLYTDPYYDIAKLSHSVVGGYDFINSGQFELVFDTDLSLRLTSEISQRSWAASIFHEQLAQSGFDVQLVRLYEASLFISMLPLHIDNPKKVLGFILTAAQILDELENQ